MFVKAIEAASQFTRPIHIIERFYDSQNIIPGAATLFFINNTGWALTCKHVAEVLIATEKIAQRKSAFEADFAIMNGKKKERQIYRELEQKYKLSRKDVFEIKYRIINCIEGPLNIEMIGHQTLDVALLHFRDFTKILCTSFPIFPKDTLGLKQGKFLCRLGYPFPEFTNFEYNQQANTIDWTKTGKDYTPPFPIEGMLTRHLGGQNNEIIGFEMSTPGLRGQSGGPAFDCDGKVWGMQSKTNHLDLDFDVNMEVIREGEKKKIHESSVLHVGWCVHVDILKSFMKQHGVAFQEV